LNKFSIKGKYHPTLCAKHLKCSTYKKTFSFTNNGNFKNQAIFLQFTEHIKNASYLVFAKVHKLDRFFTFTNKIIRFDFKKLK